MNELALFALVWFLAGLLVSLGLGLVIYAWRRWRRRNVWNETDFYLEKKASLDPAEFDRLYNGRRIPDQDIEREDRLVLGDWIERNERGG